MTLYITKEFGMSNLIYRNEKGMVLPLGLMFLAIIAILGTTAVIITTTDLKIGTNYRTSEQAFHAAEAGINEALYRLSLFDDGGTNASPSGSMININGLTNNNAAINIDPNCLLSNSADDDGDTVVDEIDELNYNGGSDSDNRNWKTKIMLATSESGFTDTYETIYTTTIQPSANWLEYSSSTADGTELTVEYKQDTNDMDGDGDTSEIVFYDGNDERASDATYPYNVDGLGGQDASGQPVVVITSTGRSAGSERTIQVEATYQPVDIQAESAVMVNMNPDLGAAILISGLNHDGTVSLGDENLPPPNNRWLLSSDTVLAGVDYSAQTAVIAAFRANGTDNYGGGNQPDAFDVKDRDDLCTVGSEFCLAYPTAPCCDDGEGNPASAIPADYSCNPSGSPCTYDGCVDYDTDLIEWGWAADDCSIGVNREDWHELEDGVPYGGKLESTGHKPGIWSTVNINVTALNIDVFGGDKAGTTAWLSEGGGTWMEFYEMLGFDTQAELDAVLASANVTVADQDGASGKLEATPQGLIYIDNAGGNALDIAAATPDYDDGWGLMYITGDVSISAANFQFKGLVYVEGDLNISGSGLFVGCLAVNGAASGAGITGSPHILYSYDALTQYANKGLKFVILTWKDDGLT
jgi:PilX N-terminal